ncbi:coiled-coil-helix-coiled-coil-helix domain-containing protein 7 isoform X2 [Lissotriton helveticus]
MSKNVRTMRDIDLNPCLEETDASSKCMDDNNYKKDQCNNFFLKYKNCRKFWSAVMMQRRREGVKPTMPTAEERKIILESIGEVPY